MNIITYVSYTYLIKRIYQNLTHTPKNVYISFLLQNIKISTWERDWNLFDLYDILMFQHISAMDGGYMPQGCLIQPPHNVWRHFNVVKCTSTKIYLARCANYTQKKNVLMPLTMLISAWAKTKFAYVFVCEIWEVNWCYIMAVKKL